METNNKPLTYAKVKKYIKQLIKLIDTDKVEFAKVVIEFRDNCNWEDRANKLSFINYNCWDLLDDWSGWGRIDETQLIHGLIHQYREHLLKVDYSNTDYVRAELKKDFGKWAR